MFNFLLNKGGNWVLTPKKNEKGLVSHSVLALFKKGLIHGKISKMFYMDSENHQRLYY